MKELALVAGLILLLAVIFLVLRPLRPRQINPLALSPLAAPTATVIGPLEVNNPKQNTKLGNLLSISLRLSQPPANIRFRLYDASGRILAANSHYVTGVDAKITSAYALPHTPTGYLEVFIENDPKIVTIPVSFPLPLVSTRVYFYSSDCRTLLPVDRLVPQKTNLDRAQMDALVTGLTTIDINNGLRSALNPSSRISGYGVVNGLAAVNFTRDILVTPTVYPPDAVCPPEVMAAQIKRTLFQNPGIFDISIAVDSKLPSRLQP